MEKTCAAEKNRTTDTMWVEKKGEVFRTEKSLTGSPQDFGKIKYIKNKKRPKINTGKIVK